MVMVVSLGFTIAKIQTKLILIYLNIFFMQFIGKKSSNAYVDGLFLIVYVLEFFQSFVHYQMIGKN